MSAIDYRNSGLPTLQSYQGRPSVKTDGQTKSGSAVQFSAATGTAGFGYGDNLGGSYKQFDKMDTSPIIPEIRISNYSFRVREIILGVVSVIALVACLVLIAIVATNSSSSADSGSSTGVSSAQVAQDTLCLDAPCLRAASYAVSNMNMSVKPCDNFYQYACGQYAANNPLSPDISQRTVFWNLYYNNEDKLRNLLEGPIIRSSGWSSEKKLKDFFMSCIDDYGKMNAGGKTFIDKIIQPLGGWDVLNTFNPSNFDLQTNLQKTSIDFWTAALFTFRVATDWFSPTNRVIEIDLAGMGMVWSYFTRPNTQQIRDDYKKFMRTVAQYLARDSGLQLDPSVRDNKIETFVNDAYDMEYQLANITANTLPSDNPHAHENRISLGDLTQQTGNVIDFVSFFQHMFGSGTVSGGTQVIVLEDDWLRRMLAMVQGLPAADKNRKLQNYMIWRLAQSYATELSWDYIHASRDFFVDQYGVAQFLGSWRHCFYLVDQKFPDALGSLFIKDHFADTNTVKGPRTGTRARMSSKFRKFGFFSAELVALEHFPKDFVWGRKLSNYIIWRLAQRYAQELSWDYIHANRVFHVDKYGEERFMGTWYHCFWHADHSMGDALGSLYAEQHFNTQNKRKAEEIVTYVKQAVMDSIDRNTIMDGNTKATAKTKLQASTDKIGYPDIYERDSDIDNVYQSLAINRSDYFQNLLNLNQFEKTDWTRRLTTGEDRTQWPYKSYDTSMTFYNSWNQLLIPAGMLQFPVYEWTLPHYTNFGVMGGLVGHYLVHAIDTWGSYYNQNGAYGNWWSNTTRNNYVKAQQCFAGVYGNKTMGPYLDAAGNPQTVQVDGNRFAWEGMAETSGVRIAFAAYKKWVADKGQEKVAPTMHYTNDQSFFLAYAQSHCFNRNDRLSYSYALTQRVPEDVRTNTALSLLKDFSDAFSCPAGSPMNPLPKCNMF